jgi:RNA polymerase-binding transcription factor DksA
MIDYEEFQKLLEENRKNIVKRIRKEKLESKEIIPKPVTTDHSRLHEDQLREALLLARAEKQLKEIEAGIEKLENHRFGKCEKYGEILYIM